MGCAQAWMKCPLYSASSASTCEGRRACSPQGQGACLVWGRKGPWSCDSFSKRMSVKDPEPVAPACAVGRLQHRYATHPSRAEAGLGTWCPVSADGCSRFSWQPGSPIQPPSAVGALPSTSSQQLSASSHFVVPQGVSRGGGEPTCRALFDPEFAFLVQHSWVAEK